MFKSLKNQVAVSLYPLARWSLHISPQRWQPALWEWIRAHVAWRSHETRFRTVQGFELEGDIADVVQSRIYFFGVWEPVITAFVQQRLRTGDTFIDVGANVGYYSMLASSLVGPTGSVIAIEASPRIYQSLLTNIRLNALGNIRTTNVAASDAVGELELYEANTWNRGSTTTSATWAAKSQLSVSGRVPALPMDQIVTTAEFSRCRLIKIDVEGAEWSVCRGLIPALAGARPDLEILVEVTPSELKAHQHSSREFIQMFGAAGFFPYVIDNDYNPHAYMAPTLTPPRRLSNLDLEKQTDMVFSRADAAQLA